MIETPRAAKRSGTGRGPGSGAAGPRDGDLSSAAIAARRLGGGRSMGKRRAVVGPLMRLKAGVARIKPMRTLVFGAFAVTLCGIVANAVVFQSGRHPAPLLGGAAPGSEAAPPKPVAAVLPPAPAPAPRVASAAPAEQDTPQPAAPEVPPPAKHATPKHPAKSAVHGDGIARLLGDKAAPAAASDKDAALLAAQRHLAKLGFAVKPNGRMDPATQRAIASFARDHHLPESAVLTPRLSRDIAAASVHPVVKTEKPSDDDQTGSIKPAAKAH